ncbi:MAG TPA: hypothetical protein VNO79_04670, partial [Actinomycetota bacterium]|nr:hypothetical protein [Actinomycetota bacterium]
MATWRVDLHALNSPTALVTGLPIKDSQIRFSYRLNGPGAFEAPLIFDDPAVTEANLAPGKRELRVYRDGVLVWGGYLWAIRVRRPRELTIVGEGYLSRLRRTHVYTSLRYQATAQEQIVRGLVDHVQSQSGGSMGIDTTLAGNHTGGSLTRTRTYCRGDAIWDAIEELTSLDDGLDLEITPSPTSSANKVLKTYQPRKGS